VSLAVDASAVLAVLLDEPDAEMYLSQIMNADSVWISSVNWWEVQVRMSTLYGPEGATAARAWMNTVGLSIEPVTLIHAETALTAFMRYKGRPARLNMGDCFAYSLAKTKGVPLLYKGSDFMHTDIAKAEAGG
jgi:ribonuclease VapC